MTHDELLDTLAHIEAALAERREIWREVVEPDDKPGTPIYRGHAYISDSPREPDTGEQP